MTTEIDFFRSLDSKLIWISYSCEHMGRYSILIDCKKHSVVWQPVADSAIPISAKEADKLVDFVGGRVVLLPYIREVDKDVTDGLEISKQGKAW